MFQDNPICNCGNGEQTIKDVVTKCQRRKFDQGFEDLNAVTPEAIYWIINLDTYNYVFFMIIKNITS